MQSFTYDDAWHESTDGDGYSLTVLDVSAHVVYWEIAAGWRPSGRLGGSPGFVADAYFTWAWDNFPHALAVDPAISGTGIDLDGDGYSNLVEYALGTDPLTAHDRGYFQSIIESDGAIVLALTYQTAAVDTQVAVEFSADLVNWIPADPELQLYISGITPQGIPESTVIDRVALDDSGSRRFARLKITR